MVQQLRLEQADTPEFLDTVYVLLADSHRRNALQYLLTTPGSTTTDRLALELAAIEYELAPEQVTATQQHELFLHLTHVHLPMLRETGVLTWNQDTERVALTPLVDQLAGVIPDLSEFFGVSKSIRAEPTP